MVAMVAGMVVVAVVKVMLWDVPFINMLIDVRADAVIDTLVGVDIIVAAAVVSALEFAVPIS